MTTKQLATKLEIKSWDENPYQELAEGRKLTHANVVLGGDKDGATLDGVFTALMYYRPDGTSTYVGLMHLAGRLGDEEGTFVLRGTGTFDGTSARIEFVVVAGSGTGDLASITGTSESVSTHDDYPFFPLALSYSLE